MARTYRFFTRHLTWESLPRKAEQPLRLTETLEPDIFYQMIKVLRAAPGDKVVLLPAGQGAPHLEYYYGVESANKKEIVLRFSGTRENRNELSFDLELILCLPNRPDKLEFILQKAVELGVSRVVLLEGNFSQMKHALRPERLEKIMIEAAEQSERALVPGIIDNHGLRKYLEGLGSEELAGIYVALERDGDARKLQEMMRGVKPHQRVAILIGPEGGFSEQEKSLIGRLRLKCFTLGRRILRMETAAILSLGLAAENG